MANSRGLHKGKALVRGQRLLMNLIFSSRLFGAPHATVRLDHRADAGFRTMVATYPRLYARKGWTMFRSIDRVYDASKIGRRLGFACRTGFAQVLAGLASEG